MQNAADVIVQIASSGVMLLTVQCVALMTTEVVWSGWSGVLQASVVCIETDYLGSVLQGMLGDVW